MGLFNGRTDIEDENRSQQLKKDKTAINNNSIIAPVFYLSFSSISLISFHKGPRWGGRNFSHAITQETTLPQEG